MKKLIQPAETNDFPHKAHKISNLSVLNTKDTCRATEINTKTVLYALQLASDHGKFALHAPQNGRFLRTLRNVREENTFPHVYHNILLTHLKNYALALS